MAAVHVTTMRALSYSANFLHPIPFYPSYHRIIRLHSCNWRKDRQKMRGGKPSEYSTCDGDVIHLLNICADTPWIDKEPLPPLNPTPLLTTSQMRRTCGQNKRQTEKKVSEKETRLLIITQLVTKIYSIVSALILLQCPMSSTHKQ